MGFLAALKSSTAPILTDQCEILVSSTDERALQQVLRCVRAHVEGCVAQLSGAPTVEVTDITDLSQVNTLPYAFAIVGTTCITANWLRDLLHTNNVPTDLITIEAE